MNILRSALPLSLLFLAVPSPAQTAGDFPYEVEDDLFGTWELKVQYYIQYLAGDGSEGCQQGDGLAGLEAAVEFKSDGAGGYHLRVVDDARILAHDITVDRPREGAVRLSGTGLDGTPWVGWKRTTVGAYRRYEQVTEVKGEISNGCGGMGEGLGLPFVLRRVDPMPAWQGYTLGTPNYYRLRHNDFVSRHLRRTGSSPPTYYMDYGFVNLNRFIDSTRPRVSDAGKGFLDRVAVVLQQIMERDIAERPGLFGEFERHDAEFLAYAYNTHVEAYCAAGWDELSSDDKTIILDDISSSDLLDGVDTSLNIHLDCPSISDYPAMVRTLLGRLPGLFEEWDFRL